MTGQSYSVLSIKEAIDRHEKPGLPGEINPAGLNEMSVSTLKHWDHWTEQLFFEVGDTIREAILSIVASDSVCGPWSGSLLHQRMGSTISNIVNTNMCTELEKALELARREIRSPPVVADNERFEKLCEDEEKLLIGHRRRARGKKYYEMTNGAVDNDTKLKKFIDSDKFSETVGPDPYLREVRIMAKMRAYYRIVATRFVEYVIVNIEAGLIQSLDQLKDGIVDVLGLKEQKGKAHCGICLYSTDIQPDEVYWGGLLEQDADRIEQRRLLTSQYEALNRALQDLNALELQVDLPNDEEGIDVDAMQI